MDNNIKLVDTEEEIYDKKQIALAIKNSTFDSEMSCSLLIDRVLKDCSSCLLKSICKRIDEVAEEYLQETTSVTKEFSF